MSERVNEKTLKRYVVACISDNYCWYIRSVRSPVENQIVAHVEYTMVTDIELADKYASRSIANTIRDDYLRMSKDTVDLVVIPLEIEYNLVKEI